ncbi:Inner membrane protein YpjD [Thalassocella blandensis]|nr:Inner membrane protein YpjD [Thalassocella blandensis]
MLINLLTTGLYLLTWIYVLRTLLKRESLTTNIMLGLMATCLCMHGISTYLSLFDSKGLHLGLLKVTSLFFFVINLLVTVSSLKKPLHSLFLVLLPLTIIGLLTSQAFDGPIISGSDITPELIAHILLSILAYSLLAIASFQAMFLAYQSKQLKNKHFSGIMGIMPPLQTMETLMFELVWTGFIFLTLSILTGVIFIEDMLAQKLTHKTVFSIISWVIYAILLGGRHRLGWRGAVAIRYVLGGFAALMLAYFGTKIVLEFILAAR